MSGDYFPGSLVGQHSPRCSATGRTLGEPPDGTFLLRAPYALRRTFSLRLGLLRALPEQFRDGLIIAFPSGIGQFKTRGIGEDSPAEVEIVLGEWGRGRYLALTSWALSILNHSFSSGLDKRDVSS